jgi:hypothetical protein
MGRYLFQTYGRFSTANNYTSPTGIVYDKKCYTLIYKLNANDLIQQTTNGMVNGTIAGCAFAGFIISWDTVMDKSGSFYTNITSTTASTITNTTTSTATTTMTKTSFVNKLIGSFYKALYKPLPFSLSGSLFIHITVNTVMYGTYELVKPIIYRFLQKLLLSDQSTDYMDNMDLSVKKFSMDKMDNNNNNNTNNGNNTKAATTTSATSSNSSSNTNSNNHHHHHHHHHTTTTSNNNTNSNNNTSNNNNNTNSNINNIDDDDYDDDDDDDDTNTTTTIHPAHILADSYLSTLAPRTIRFLTISISGAIAGITCELINYYGDYLVSYGFRKQPLIVNNTNSSNNNSSNISNNNTNNNNTNSSINNNQTNNNSHTKLKLPYATFQDGFKYIRNKPLPRIGSLAFTMGFPCTLGFLAFEHGKEIIVL